MIRNKKQLKLFYYKWLLQLKEREPKLRGKKLKYNKFMQNSLKQQLGL